MAEITDEFMRERLTQTKAYTLVLLRKTEKLVRPDADPIIWEHGRRNFSLREDGMMPIVCPVNDGSDLSGIGIFDTTPEEAARIMDGDPGVQAGIFSYEVHPTRTFPGSTLPA